LKVHPDEIFSQFADKNPQVQQIHLKLHSPMEIV
jgi:hypothetical protein